MDDANIVQLLQICRDTITSARTDIALDDGQDSNCSDDAPCEDDQDRDDLSDFIAESSDSDCASGTEEDAECEAPRRKFKRRYKDTPFTPTIDPKEMAKDLIDDEELATMGTSGEDDDGEEDDESKGEESEEESPESKDRKASPESDWSPGMGYVDRC